MKSVTAILLTSSLLQSKAWTSRQALFVSSHSAKAKTKTTAASNLNGSNKHNPNARLPTIADPLFVRGGASLQSSPVTIDVVRTLAPRIGVLTSTLLYFSPFATVRKAVSDDSLGTLNPIPLAFMALSSFCWLVYGLFIRNPYVTLSNVLGCIASIWYVVMLLPLLKEQTLRTTQGLVVMLSAITINVWTWLSLTKRPMTEVSSALGLYASFLSIIFCGSPLSTIKTVITTKNSTSILTHLTFAQVTNAALWGAYGITIQDKFVWGPNAVGLGFGIIQLVLKIFFPVQSQDVV